MKTLGIVLASALVASCGGSNIAGQMLEPPKFEPDDLDIPDNVADGPQRWLPEVSGRGLTWRF